MVPKVVTFGEAMIRLSPPDFKRLEQATTLDVTVGGSELTVASGLSRLGISAAWVSRLPDNPLGRMAQNKAREFGVDTSYIHWARDERMGVYYVEFGACPRGNTVLYDRAHSSMSLVKPGDIDWRKALEGASWFHTSGITPALSPGAACVTEEALHTAKMLGCSVSYDLNYRPQLWSLDQARAVQEPLMQYVDILITSRSHAMGVFAIEDQDPMRISQNLVHRFGFDAVTLTLRTTPSIWRNTWSAAGYADGQFYSDTVYEIEVVDRIGGGDNYTAGFIFGYLTEGMQKAIRVGNAFAALKQTSWSDFNWATLAEVEMLLNDTEHGLGQT